MRRSFAERCPSPRWANRCTCSTTRTWCCWRATVATGAWGRKARSWWWTSRMGNRPSRRACLSKESSRRAVWLAARFTSRRTSIAKSFPPTPPRAANGNWARRFPRSICGSRTNPPSVPRNGWLATAASLSPPTVSFLSRSSRQTTRPARWSAFTTFPRRTAWWPGWRRSGLGDRSKTNSR